MIRNILKMFSVEHVKGSIKNLAFLSSLNAKLQCRHSKKLYSSIVSHYNIKSYNTADHSCHDILPNNPRILFLGTDYLQDSSGMLQALSSIGQVRCFEQEDGTYGLYPSLDLTVKGESFYRNTKQLKFIVEDMVSQGKQPDIIIGQLWGGVLDVKVLDLIRSRWGIKVIAIAMDDRHTYWLQSYKHRLMGSYGLVSHVDLVATAAPEAVDWYQKEGQRAVFFPEASDGSIFHPMPDEEKKYDVSFVGACYGVRKDVVCALRKAGISVTVYGHGWEQGKLPTEDVPNLFAQSKIILGVGTIGHCSDFYALKLRDFDAPMSGSMYITNDNSDLKELFVIGEEIITYHDINDCVEKITYYLKHDDEREVIAKAGLQRARAEHTWVHRFALLFHRLAK